ncbi:hypothetical protein [Pectobacterium aquaticum]|uniref:hypothetical protein n=1 Tax=Pectobacterium aquaticum TaxID=2204145 RepID=UPI001F0F6B96|nr:hypothetical protein [Pectobacterium aquaticum]MCH5052237.1 hypothetical protein [Pectobacterium aquaticum]
MSDNFFERESSKLPLDEIIERLKTMAEDGTLDDREAGILRQIDGRGIDSLSEKQRYVFKSVMIPMTVERCSIRQCNRPTAPGQAYCPMHEIEYGS